MKEDWTAYFSFSRKERNGLLLLLSLLTLLILIPRFFCTPQLTIDFEHARRLEESIDTTLGVQYTSSGNRQYSERAGAGTEGASGSTAVNVLPDAGLYEVKEDERSPGRRPADSSVTEPATGALFPFDPNTISDAGWQQLGIPVKVIRTIFNYISRGGTFRSPQDIGKIYGMKKEDVRRMMPYVKIAAKQRVRTEHQQESRPVQQSPWKKKQYSYIDINRADSASWASLPGIGNKLASRILQYRSRLGGFHDINQVSETWALPDSTFQKIKPWLLCKQPALKKILINQISAEELKRHPYFGWDITRAIISYREQHGLLQSAKDLQSILLLTPVLIQKIAPYIEYSNPD